MDYGGFCRLSIIVDNQTMIFWESLKAPFRTNWPGEAARGPIGLKMNKKCHNIFQIWRWGPDFPVYNTSWDIEIVLINESDPELQQLNVKNCLNLCFVVKFSRTNLDSSISFPDYFLKNQGLTGSHEAACIWTKSSMKWGDFLLFEW